MTPSLSFGRRLTIALLFMLIFTVVMVILTKLPLPTPLKYGTMPYAIIAAVLAVALTFVAQRWWSGSVAMPLKPDGQTIYNFLMGMIIGAGLALVLMWIIGKYSGVRIQSNPIFNPLVFASGCGAIFLMAWAEELAFRGYPLALVRSNASIWTTQAFIAVCFVIYQVVNGWTFQDALVGPGAWGLLFGLAAMRTGGIARSTGMHFAANLTQSLVGTSQFALFSMTRDIQAQETLAEDIRRSGAWTQLLMLILALVLTSWYTRRISSGKAA